MLYSQTNNKKSYIGIGTTSTMTLRRAEMMVQVANHGPGKSRWAIRRLV
jgi:hypothetical protein